MGLTNKGKWLIIRQVMKKLIASLVLAFIAFSSFAQGPAGTFSQAYGPLFHPRPTLNQPVHRWNKIALDATGLDHTPVALGEHRTFGEQLGPTRASRAMAIVHIAIFDAMGKQKSYTRVHPSAPYSAAIAVGQAAHDTLSSLYPSQKATFDAQLDSDLSLCPSPKLKANGVAFGAQVAAAILSARVGDGSERAEPRIGTGWTTVPLPGHWQQDPISLIPIALGAYWGEVKPFVLTSATQFRAPPLPSLDSTDYATAYDEVARLGGDGTVTPTQRTPEQTLIGLYWAYDGTPSLCAPPRMYNQITVHIADQMGSSEVELARLLALVNIGMADTAIGLWESKFYYDFWRPITAFRLTDPSWTPLGAPASNLNGPNFTPPFPAYPSGHAGFGGAVFSILRLYYGTDAIPFTFISDELDGVTKDNSGKIRPLFPRSFSTLSQAEEENGQSRIYLGIHWSFDKTEGIAMGEKVGAYVYSHGGISPTPRP